MKGEKSMECKPKVNYELYLVTDREILGQRDLIESIEKSILGGATLVQLREKDISTRDFYNIAVKVKALTEKYKIPLIINDRMDIALAVDAEGLHIGQSDMPLKIARKIFGNNKIIGVSTSNIEEALEAQKDGADYVGVGAIFPTVTKKDADRVTLDNLKKIKETLKIPVVAIGGINKDNVESVMETRIDGVAIISAILGEIDIKGISQTFKDKIKKYID